MNFKDLKPKKEKIKYRDKYGRLFELSYYRWLNREWMKKTRILENQTHQ